MQIEIQLLYQGYRPVTIVLIVENRQKGYSSQEKNNLQAGCFVTLKI